MKRLLTLTCAFVFARLLSPAQTAAPPATHSAVPAQPSAPVPAATLEELQHRLAEHISQPRFAAALWGIKVVSLDSGKILFEHNPQKLFSPASNSKLYTIALALDQLGPDGKIKTSLYSQRKPRSDGLLTTDLIVYGRGDPSINARLYSNDIYRALQPLVTAVTNAGIRRIEGDLVADARFLQGPPYGSGWAWDDAESYYGAELSALTINDNTLQVSIRPGDRPGAPCKLAVIPETDYLTFSNRTQTAEAGTRRSIQFYRPLNENLVYVNGKVGVDQAEFTEDATVHNPAGLFGALFRQALARNGVVVKGKVRSLNWPDPGPDYSSNYVELGFVESWPMRELAREVMKPSQNLYTDLLLAYVGEKGRQPDDSAGLTSEDLGIHELNRFLAQAGVHRGNVLFEEGSGLSRNNLTTPNATIALLQFMAKHSSAEVYLQSLPVAGVDGTLRNRMKNSAAARNVRAKTGTLRWANSLSGHVTSAAGEHLIFSIMLNRYHDTDPNRSARNDLDEIAVMLAAFTGKSE